MPPNLRAAVIRPLEFLSAGTRDLLQVAALLGCDARELIFTSGGTESDNLAILGVARAASAAGGPRHAITSAIEHPAVLGPIAQLEREGVDVTRVRVDHSGVIDPGDVRRALPAGIAPNGRKIPGQK